MKDLGVLYKATDPQGHCYIGQHAGDGSDIGKTYFGSGKYFTRTRKKHGADYFTYWVFAKDLNKEERNAGERYYIKFFLAREYQNGYNLTDGGEGGSSKGHIRSKETRQKMRDAWNNKSEEEKAKIIKKRADSRIGLKPSEETRQLIADSLLGHIVTEETREKLSISNSGKTQSDNTKHKRAETKKNRTKEEKAETSRKLSDSNKISQNRPEVKKAKSINGKIAQKKPEVIDRKRYAMHIRWDVNRGITNPNCKFCVGH